MMSWSDLYGDSPVQVVEPDPAETALLQLAPEEKREELRPLLRAYLASVKMQLIQQYQSNGDWKVYYEQFCNDMVLMGESHLKGDHETAQKVADRYGMPYAKMIEMADGISA